MAGQATTPESLGYEIIYVWCSDDKEIAIQKILKTYYLCE
jgi:hypothetical protein